MQTVPVDCTVVPAGYEPVAYRLPKKGESYLIGRTAIVAESDFKSEPMLIIQKAIPEPPRMVPLGPDDVIVGTTVIHNYHWPKTTVWGVVSKCLDGVTVMPSGVRHGQDITAEYKKFDRLSVEPFEYSNDHGQTWAKCEKPA